MISLANITTQMNVCKTLAIALPQFFLQTKISVSFYFSHKPDGNELELSLAFKPKEPTEAEYNLLFEEIINAEKLLLNEYILNSAVEFDNLKQFVFKHKESTRQIIEKNKEILRNES